MALTQVSMGGTPAASGGSNPFGQTTPAPAGGLIPAQPVGGLMPAAAVQQQLGIPVILPNGQTITVSSQNDVAALRAMIATQTQPIDLRAGGAASPSTTSTGGLIDVAADGFQAVGAYLAGRTYNQLLSNYQQNQNDLITAENNLQAQLNANPGQANVIQPILDAFDALSASLDSGIQLLNAQITAVDMMAGGSAAKVVASFLQGNNGAMGGGTGFGTAAALGLGGLGVGLLLSNNNNNTTQTVKRTR